MKYIDNENTSTSEVVCVIFDVRDKLGPTYKFKCVMMGTNKYLGSAWYRINTSCQLTS